MTVRQLLASVDSLELSEWKAHYKIEYEDDVKARLNAELESKARSGIRHGNNR